MDRLLHSTVPTTKSQRQPQLIDQQSVKRKDKSNKERQKRNFDSRRGARELPPLESVDLVWLPDKEVEGEVSEEVAPQSYTVESSDGSYRRNRKDIICLPNSQQSGTSDDIEPKKTSSTVHRSSRHSKLPERLDPSWAN